MQKLKVPLKRLNGTISPSFWPSHIFYYTFRKMEYGINKIPWSSMGGKWGVGKKEMCHRPHGVLITITKHGEQKKLVIGHEKPPTTPTWRFGLNQPFWAFAENFYIFIFAGLDPKLFAFKSLTQQQSWRAYTIGQFCHQVDPLSVFVQKLGTAQGQPSS